MDTAGRIAAAAPELAARLASFVARERLPGTAAGVVCGDELPWLAGAAVPGAAVPGAAVLDAAVLDAAVLDAASVREMHKPRYLADDQWTEAWGISWCGTRREDVTWIGHSGGIPGFTSTICFDPAAQVGAVVLANGTCGGVALGMELAAAARDLTRDRPPAPGTPPAPAPERYRPLLGVYARASLGGWLLRLEWRDGKLTFTAGEAPGWQVVLTPTPDPDRFAVADGSTAPGGSVTFRRSAGGRVVSVFFLDFTWVRLDRVTA